MAVYQKIQKSFWTDSKVDDCFTPEDKYIYLYLLTNPHTNMVGCYELSMKQIGRETGYSVESIHRVLSRLQNEHKVIIYDHETKEILILNWFKYNWSSSPKVAAPMLEDINLVKNHSFRDYLTKLFNNGVKQNKAPNPKDDDTVSIVYANSTDTLSRVEIENVREENTEETGNSTDTVSQEYPYSIPRYPDREQLRNFCTEHGMTEEFSGELFDRYSANGWTMDSGESIRNWRNVVLSAWRKAKKSGRKEPAPAGKQKGLSYSPEDLVEFPYGSGLYRLRSEIEGISDG